MRIAPKAAQAPEQSVVTDVALAMLDRLATLEPARVAAERRVFDALRTAYFADPRRALGGAESGGKLAFGLPGVEELLTPVLLAASAEVVRYLADRGAAATAKGVRRLLGLRPEAAKARSEAAKALPEAAEARSEAAEALPEERASLEIEVDLSADDILAPQPLTIEQWAEVRRIVSRACVRHGRMSPQRAELIAAAVIGDGITGDDEQ